MSTLAGFIIAITGPVVLRIMMVLGLSVITFTGVTDLVQQLIGSAQSSWGALPSQVLGLAALAGVPEALGIICGAFAARATLWAATSAIKIGFQQ